MHKPHGDPTTRALAVIEGLKGRPVKEICSKHGISAAEYNRWREQLLSNLTRTFEASTVEGFSNRVDVASLFAVLGKSRKELPEQLHIAQELIEVLPIPVFFNGRDGKYLGVNKAWETFFGVPRETFIGKTVHDLYPQSPWIADKHVALDQELWDHPGTQSYEIPATTHDGQVRHVIDYKATFTRANGEVAGLIGAIIDITERKRAEQAVRESEERFRLTFDLAGSGIAHVDLDGRFRRVNRSLCTILGYSAEELAARTVKDISHPGDRDITDAERARVRSGELESARFQKRYLRKDGSTVWVELTVALVRDADGKPLYEIAVFDDDTERKQAELALRESEERFRSLTEVSSDWYWQQDEHFRFTMLSGGVQDSIGIPPQAFLGKTRWDAAAIGMTDADWAAHKATLEAYQHFKDFEYGRLDAQGRVRYLSVSGEPIFDEHGRFVGYRGVGRDVTERRQAEQRQAIEHAVTLLLADARSVAEAMPRVIQAMCDSLGYAYGARWVIDVKERVLRSTESWCVGDPATDEFRRMSTARVETPTPDKPGGLNRKVWATGAPVWIANVAQDPTLNRREPALQAGLHSAFAFPILVGGEFYGVMEFFARETRPRDERVLEIARTVGHQIGQFIGRKQAEAALRKAHDELARRAQDLARSNAELEQFAYVASHDLQEPLRMISSYTQIIVRRYGDRLDSDAKEFMDFVVDGAARMKQLIEDLLAYSRVGTHGKEFQSTECEAALQKALANLRAAIESSGATVTHDPLPTVDADDRQLMQLFQNLIGNALKFRGTDTPHIHIGKAEQADAWKIAVKDNGIGIDSQYFERIFMVFQRLHGKAEYPGTGIGLAICKKVVDRHGGRIWVESQPGHGSIFYFTLPKNTVRTRS